MVFLMGLEDEWTCKMDIATSFLMLASETITTDLESFNT